MSSDSENDISQTGIALQLSALRATFESFQSDVNRRMEDSTRSTESRMDRWERDVVGIASGVKDDVGDVKAAVNNLRRELKEEYVTKQEFEPIRKIVDRAMLAVIGSVIAALLALVIKVH